MACSALLQAGQNLRLGFLLVSQDLANHVDGVLDQLVGQPLPPATFGQCSRSPHAGVDHQTIRMRGTPAQELGHHRDLLSAVLYV